MHGHQPEALLLATIVSIPKDKNGDICSDTNYRGIALSSSIGKVLDRLLLWNNKKQLATSNLQFAYKEKHGTSMCTLVLKEVIKYYLNRQTDVYSCFIDASKAFDKIRHDKLFELLIRRGVSAIDLRVLLDLYLRQNVRTVWNGCHSDTFPATNGIRQGSISSPILFCCYMDELLSRLEKRGTGCWIGQYFYGGVSYADDLTLLSPTAMGLQSLISVCEDYGHEYGMTYNPLKSLCVLFSRRKLVVPNITLNGQCLKWENHVKHLGNVLTNNLSEKHDVRLKRGDLAGRTNVIVGNLHQMSSDIILKMFSSQCCHYYVTQIWQFSKSSLGDFCMMWNCCVRRLLKLPNMTHCRFLPLLANMKSPGDQICGMFVGLLRSMRQNDNHVVKFLIETVLNDARSYVGYNLHYISRRYGCQSSDILKGCKLALSNCTSKDKQTIQGIKDILNGHLSHFMTNTEQYEFFNFLCCK
jgi:hypothetical protein